MKKLRQIKRFRTMCWKLLAAVIAGLLSMLADLDPSQYAVVISVGTIVLDQAMKLVNTKILNDVGVEK